MKLYKDYQSKREIDSKVQQDADELGLTPQDGPVIIYEEFRPLKTLVNIFKSLFTAIILTAVGVGISIGAYMLLSKL